MAQSLTEIYAKQFASFLAIGNGRNDQEDSVKCQFYYPDGPNPSKPNDGGEMCADTEAVYNAKKAEILSRIKAKMVAQYGEKDGHVAVVDGMIADSEEKAGQARARLNGEEC